MWNCQSFSQVALTTRRAHSEFQLLESSLSAHLGTRQRWSRPSSIQSPHTNSSTGNIRVISTLLANVQVRVEKECGKAVIGGWSGGGKGVVVDIDGSCWSCHAFHHLRSALDSTRAARRRGVGEAVSHTGKLVLIRSEHHKLQLLVHAPMTSGTRFRRRGVYFGNVAARQRALVVRRTIWRSEGRERFDAHVQGKIVALDTWIGHLSWSGEMKCFGPKAKDGGLPILYLGRSAQSSSRRNIAGGEAR